MYTRSLFSTLLPTFIICKLFDDSYSEGMRWYRVVLICISLIISHVELLLTCLLAIRMSSLKKGLSKTSAHFFYWIVSFWFSAVWAVYIFWILTPWWLYHLQIFFPIPIGCLFILLMISSAVQKPLIRCHLLIFTFISFALRDRSKKKKKETDPKKILLQFMSEFCLCFPLGVLWLQILHLGL